MKSESIGELLARIHEVTELATPESAFWYAKNIVRGFWPLGEAVIQQSPYWSLSYAIFTKERFLEGEEKISTSAQFSYLYALDVLHGPFPAGEPAIAMDALNSYLYACFVLHGPFPAGEPTISKSAEYSFRYVREVLHGPFPSGEPVIATDKLYSKLYVRDVLDGDWSRFNKPQQ